jgi:diguanylate cyclase (GGDEF)-like protein
MMSDMRPLPEDPACDTEKLRACVEIGKLLTSTLDLQEILEVILQKGNELIQARNWSLLLKDQTTGELTFDVVVGIEKESVRGVRMPPGVGIAGYVAQTGESLFIPDVQADPRFNKDIDLKTGFTTRSIICVPLNSHGKTLGVIEVINVADMTVFEAEGLPILEILADYAAVAIHNSLQVARIEKMSITDEYTGLYNARYLHQLVDRLVEETAREPSQFSVVFVDVDDFKDVVDCHGHLGGSQILKEIGATMASCLSDTDILIKYGGDEYVIVMPGRSKADAREIARGMLAQISGTTYLRSEECPVTVTASFGVAGFPDDARSKKELLIAADNSMYEVKNTTKNGVGVA